MATSRTAPPHGPPPELLFSRPLRPGAMARELWAGRELVRVLAERDLRARYKQTKVGFAWALLTPFMLMVVFTLIFKRVADVPTDGIPYPIFPYVGLLPWTFFSRGRSSKGGSASPSNPLLNKVYCPREVFPISDILGRDRQRALRCVDARRPLRRRRRVPPPATSYWVRSRCSCMLVFTRRGHARRRRPHRVPPRHAPRAPARPAARAVPHADPLRPGQDPGASGATSTSRSTRSSPIIDGMRRCVLFGRAPDGDLHAHRGGRACVVARRLLRRSSSGSRRASPMSPDGTVTVEHVWKRFRVDRGPAAAATTSARAAGRVRGRARRERWRWVAARHLLRRSSPGESVGHRRRQRLPGSRRC